MPNKLAFLILVLSLLFRASNATAGDPSDSGVKVFFSPQDECGKVILDKINLSEKAIDIAMYYFTSRTLAQALVSAVKRGVQVRVFLDGESAREYYSKADFLKKNGVLVKLEEGEGLMHNKFCIIDDSLVIMGSYNWTTSADLQNDENIVLLSSPAVVRAYRAQFEKYWQGKYLDKAYYTNKKTLQK